MWNIRGLFHGACDSRVFKFDGVFAAGLAKRLLTAHDIVVLSETHLTDATSDDCIAIPGYTVFRADRSSEARAGFGGVAVYVRTTLLSTSVSVLRCDRSVPGVEVVWLRVTSDTGTCLLGACYLAPEDSKVYEEGGGSVEQRELAADTAYGRLQHSIESMRLPTDEIMIMGDLNARVGGRHICDFPDISQLQALAEQGLDVLDCSSFEGIHQGRTCQDTSDNIFGRRLADMCRSAGIVICNGRVPGDPDGRITFPTLSGGGSTIDLVLASPNMLRSCKWMKVGELLWHTNGPSAVRVSDHRPVMLLMHSTVSSSAPCVAKKGKKKVAFDAAQWKAFAALFTSDDSPYLAGAKAVCEELANGRVDSTQAVDKLSKVLGRALVKAFAGAHEAPGNECPWWNDDCQAARDTMFERRQLAGGMRDGPAWTSFCDARRQYNKAKRLAKATYDERMLRNFFSKCKTDQKQLWRMLRDEGKAACDIDDMGVWTRHFAALLDTGSREHNPDGAHRALSFINSLAKDTSPEWWQNCSKVSRRREQAATILNSPLTLEEVTAAINALPNGKSPGNESVPAECYKYARKLRGEGDEPGAPEMNRLAPVLLVLLQHIFDHGDFPKQFTTTLVTPVFKKGDPAIPGNYRGIAVGGALAKLYASVLLSRLVKMGEVLQNRHAGQAGFRCGYGTTHHLFVKRVLTDKHRRVGAAPLIVVQIDFEKAFDRVPREVLWLRLQERGVHGPFLAAIMKAYERVEMRVKVNGRTGEAFLAKLGVKQGDPLSTELFGLFIEALGDLIDANDLSETSRYAEEAPSLGARKISLLFYADDVSLLATSARRMRELLSYVDEFCACFGMRANVKKCERMVFADCAERAQSVASECEDFVLGGERVPAVTKAKYLGLVYGPSTPFTECRQALHDSARGAMFGLIAALNKRRIHAPDVRMRAFDTQVRAIATYGCEVWGTDVLEDAINGGPFWNRARDRLNLAEGMFEAALKEPITKLQITFMRSCVGMKRPAHRLLFAEMAQLPVQYFVCSQLVGFVNRTQKQRGSYCWEALKEELIEGRLLPEGTGWGSAFLRVCSGLGIDLWRGKPRRLTLAKDEVIWLLSKPLPEADILQALRNKLMSGWSHERMSLPVVDFPSDGKRPGIHMAKYKHWMGLAFEGNAPPTSLAHMSAVMEVEAHKCLMRFRLCGWPLAANRETHKARCDRICTRCDLDAVEDEEHVLCWCTAYAEIREEAHLLRNIKANMQSCDQVKLARALLRIWNARFRTIDTSSD